MIESNVITKFIGNWEDARYKTNAFIGNKKSFEKDFCEELRANRSDALIVRLEEYLDIGELNWSSSKLSKMTLKQFDEERKIIEEKLNSIKDELKLSNDSDAIEQCYTFDGQFKEKIIKPFMDNKEALAEQSQAWIRFCIKDIQRFCILPEFVIARVDDETILLDTKDGKLWQKGTEKVNDTVFEPVMVGKIEYPDYYEGVINALLDICPVKLVTEQPEQAKVIPKKESIGYRLARTFF